MLAFIGNAWADYTCTLAYGASESSTVNVDFSAMSGDVSCSNPYFTFSPDVVGAAHGDNCEYGSQTVTVTFNANGEAPAGIYNATLYIGETPISLSATVLPLPAPVVQVTDVRSTAVSVSWNSVANASSYTVYQNGVAVQTGVTGTSYQFTGLNQATQYNFSVKSVRGAAESEMSNVVEAVTYSVLTIEKAGEFADAITYTVVGEEGKWNAEETSFANNSKATLTASIDATSYPCAVFDKILVGETEYANPAEITMTAPATATISYKYATLAKPTATLLKDNSKNTIGISWDSVDCADSYTVYKDGVEEQTGVTSKEYWFSDLDEATTYAFSVKAVRGTSESEVSDPVTATTNTTSMNVEITGTFGPKGTASVKSTKWNPTEISYSIGSTAKVKVTSLPEDCEVESVVANNIDITGTETFEVLAQNSVVITYRYTGTGVAEVVDEHGNVVYGTLSDAVDKAEDGANINLLGDVEQDLVVNKHIYFNGNGHKIQNMYIKKDGNVELTGDVNVVMDFGLEVTPDKAGQYDAHDKSLTPTSMFSLTT